jgi:hypothetical protein
MLKNIDGLIDLWKQSDGIEESISIFARLEDNLGFPDGCKCVRWLGLIKDKRETHSFSLCSCPQSGVRKSDTISV